MRFTTWRAACAVAVFVGATQARATECQSLAGKTFGDALVTEATEYHHPVTIASYAVPSGVAVTTPFCRVTGLIRPVDDSSTVFEVWMPSSAIWNGKFLAVGNHGASGSVRHDDMAIRLARGYAVAGSDAGHTSMFYDAGWMLGHPQKVIDWSWRSHHLTAVSAKAIISAFYSRAPKRSYFVACSVGGRSAMMEAQRFPGDYDGIIAGAPALNQSRQISSFVWNHQAVTAPGGWISPQKLTLLRNKVLAACGGAKLGYLENPAACTYDPGRLLCRKGDGEDCLTPSQVETVRRIYSGPLDETGKPFYVGFPRGSEYTWSDRLFGPKENPGFGATMWPSVQTYTENLILGRRGVDFARITPQEVYRIGQDKFAATIDAVDPDLGPFQARGGKLIHYIGWDDSSIRPGSSTGYYDSVVEKLGGLDRVQSFYRLFMAPGMEHCGGGVAPNLVGQGGPAGPKDPQHDILSALETWVEEGRAPDKLVATRYVDNNPAKGIAAQRPWCVYPATARLKPHGDPSQATSFECSTKRK